MGRTQGWWVPRHGRTLLESGFAWSRVSQSQHYWRGVVRSCPVCHLMVSSIPGLCPLNASNKHPSSSFYNQKCLQTLLNVPGVGTNYPQLRAVGLGEGGGVKKGWAVARRFRLSNRDQPLGENNFWASLCRREPLTNPPNVKVSGSLLPDWAALPPGGTFRASPSLGGRVSFLTLPLWKWQSF